MCGVLKRVLPIYRKDELSASRTVHIYILVPKPQLGNGYDIASRILRSQTGVWERVEILASVSMSQKT